MASLRNNTRNTRNNTTNNTRNTRNNTTNNIRNTPVEIAFRETIQDFISKPLRTKEIYALTFAFDDKVYQINFNIIKYDANIVINNKCLTLSYLLKECLNINTASISDNSSPINTNKSVSYAPIYSSIKKNTPANMCFSPVLSPETLPGGVSQTDILQVLSTKLKSIIVKDKIIKITDVASINDSVLYFSLWRLLRGEPSLYEKYGYVSKKFNTVKETAKRIPYEITARNPLLYDDLHAYFPYVFNFANNKRSIAELMKNIPYDSVNVSNVNCITDLFHFIASISGFPTLLTTAYDNLTLNTKTSKIWREWNRRITLLNWVRIS